ncbi:MAG: hypothetical protein LBT68_03310 [Spirochaetales bacterium]|nr:hypothetical protein [Spirochaetales bacterium]
MKKIHILKIIVFILALCGCRTQSDYVTIFPVSPGVFQYYLAPTEWQTDGLEVYVDITYRNIPGNSAICNISLINSGRQPRSVSSAFFTAGGENYPLEDIARLFSELESSKLRITSTIPGARLEEMFAAAAITLTVILDGVEYVCVPPKLFLDYKTQVLNDITTP